MTGITLIVRQDHIDRARELVDNGYPATRNCPIGLAVKEQTKSFYAYVDSVIVEVDGGWYLTSQKARNFMARFDAKKPVKPTFLRLRHGAP